MPQGSLAAPLLIDQTVCFKLFHDPIDLLAAQVCEAPDVGIAERTILKQGPDEDLDRFQIQSSRHVIGHPLIENGGCLTGKSIGCPFPCSALVRTALIFIENLQGHEVVAENEHVSPAIRKGIVRIEGAYLLEGAGQGFRNDVFPRFFSE